LRALLCSLLLVAPLCARVDDQEIVGLREQFALHYLDPRSHLLLAKHLLAKGDRLTAFFISEAARRETFGDADFDPAFGAVFRDDHFDNSAEAEKDLVAELREKADDPKKHLRLADIFLSRGEWKKAEAEIRTALQLDPTSFASVDVLAEVLRRDNRKSEGEELTNGWYDKHPAAVETIRARAEKLIASKSADAEKTIQAGLVAHPDDAVLHFQLAGVLADRGDTAGATDQYVKAAELDPRSAFIQGWTGRFFLKRVHDSERALTYYLKAYFLDPHFYDSEYAESRIRTLAMEGAQSRYQAERSRKVSVETLLKDSDPVVAGLALQEAGQKWDEQFLPAIIELLRRDDPNARYGAAEVLGRHLKANDERLARLLEDDDLRVRGAAAYIAGTLRGPQSVPLMVSWLDQPAELIRYDAISVLAIHGGKAGHDALVKVRKEKKIVTPRLRTMVEEALSSTH
jgi:Tfp pilus assembly protein PilF